MCPNLDFGDSNLIHFVYGDASPYQGWLHKVQQFGMHDPDKNILEIWNVCCDLDFIPSDQFISQDTPARGDVPSVEEGREIR